MTTLKRKVLEDLIAVTAEPLLLARVDHADWPVVLSNPAFDALADRDRSDLLKQPVTDVVESMHGRDVARELGETLRTGQESSIPLEFQERSWLLVLKPIDDGGARGARYYAACWRDSASMTSGGDASAAHQALLRARRRIRDLSRDDSLTGLLNEAAFRDVLTHDWAVAAREKNGVALMAFGIDDFAAYRRVFGRHASESCLRRVAHALRRCLRRASDVAARFTDGDDEVLVVMFHATDEAAVEEFATIITQAVRALGLHHPHSRRERFVTVTARSLLTTASGGPADAERVLAGLLRRD